MLGFEQRWSLVMSRLNAKKFLGSLPLPDMEWSPQCKKVRFGVVCAINDDATLGPTQVPVVVAAIQKAAEPFHRKEIDALTIATYINTCR